MRPVHWGKDDSKPQVLRPAIRTIAEPQNRKTNPHKTHGSVEHELREKSKLFPRESVRIHKNNDNKNTLISEKIIIQKYCVHSTYIKNIFKTQ